MAERDADSRLGEQFSAVEQQQKMATELGGQGAAAEAKKAPEPGDLIEAYRAALQDATVIADSAEVPADSQWYRKEDELVTGTHSPNGQSSAFESIEVEPDNGRLTYTYGHGGSAIETSDVVVTMWPKGGLYVNASGMVAAQPNIPMPWDDPRESVTRPAANYDVQGYLPEAEKFRAYLAGRLDGSVEARL